MKSTHTCPGRIGARASILASTFAMLFAAGCNNKPAEVLPADAVLQDRFDALEKRSRRFLINNYARGVRDTYELAPYSS